MLIETTKHSVANGAHSKQDFRDWFYSHCERANHGMVIVSGVSVDPDFAQFLLDYAEKNADFKNRKLVRRSVERLAADMKRGDWINTGDTIKISTNGTLIDGQHRCMAIIESGTTQKMNFAFGVKYEAFDRIDVGAPRDTATIIEMSGLKNGKIVAAAAKALMSIERELKSSGSIRDDLSRHEIVRYVSTRSWLVNCADYASYISKDLGGRISKGGIAAGLFLIFEAGNKTDAVTPFIEIFRTGIGVKSDNDPVYHLRKRLGPTSTLKKLNQVEVAAYVIKAWNAYVTDDVIGILVWRGGTDAFPKALASGRTRLNGKKA